MGIPLRAVLLREIHCLSHNGQVVHTVQWWSDPVAEAGRPRSWMRLVLNGTTNPRHLHQRTGLVAHQQLAEDWSDLAARYEPTGLTEEQMWVKLRELTGIEQTCCVRTDCAGRLPVAWHICPACRRDTRRVAAGSLSHVRRMPTIVMDMREDPGTAV